MKKLICCLCAALLLLGCAPAKESSLTQDRTPAPVDTSDETPECAPLNAFALTLFSESLKNGDVNPVLSPLSAYLCLAMVQNGADGGTLEAMTRVMGLDTDALDTLAHTLAAQLTNTTGGTKLTIANSVWADDDSAQIADAFLDAVVTYFGADVLTVDLPSDAAREAVNAWVSEKTNGLIPTLREENYPDEAVLALINTLYFKAAWLNPFLGWQTNDDTFHAEDGAERTVPFMNVSLEERAYIGTDGAEGILLSYDDGRTAFLALRPTDGSDVRTFAASLDAERLAGYVSTAAPELMNFSMPKFTIEYGLSLNDTLRAMGLADLFDPSAADLSPMGTSTKGALCISSIMQKVKIEVNEEGTEAAAVTEAMATGSAYVEPGSVRELHLDSPFLYAVIDLTSGVPLFIGVLDDPS